MVKAIFNYADSEDIPPEYARHQGEEVKVLKLLTSDEILGDIFEIRANDGWVGTAFADELERIDDNA